jgi:hypothetical protein
LVNGSPFIFLHACHTDDVDDVGSTRGSLL